MRVNKRDGRWVEWNRKLIVRAILMAFHDVGQTISQGAVEKLATNVETVVQDAHGDDPHVEQIQDKVEQVLMAKHPEVAKAYILFRNHRAELRAQRLSPPPDALPGYIHVAKYARWQKDLGR